MWWPGCTKKEEAKKDIPNKEDKRLREEREKVLKQLFHVEKEMSLVQLKRLLEAANSIYSNEAVQKNSGSKKDSQRNSPYPATRLLQKNLQRNTIDKINDVLAEIDSQMDLKKLQNALKAVNDIADGKTGGGGFHENLVCQSCNRTISLYQAKLGTQEKYQSASRSLINDSSTGYFSRNDHLPAGSQRPYPIGSSSGRKVATTPSADEFIDKIYDILILMDSNKLQDALRAVIDITTGKTDNSGTQHYGQRSSGDSLYQTGNGTQNSYQSATKSLIDDSSTGNSLKNDYWTSASQQSYITESSFKRKAAPPPVEVPEEPPLPPINLDYTEVILPGPLFLKEKKDEKPPVLETFEQKIREQPKLEDPAPLAIAPVPEKSPEELEKYYGDKFRENTRINGMLTIDNGEHQKQMAECKQRAHELEVANRNAIQLREQKILEDRRIAESEFQMAKDAQRKEQEEELNRAKKVREDYEKETRRLMEEAFEEINRRTQTLFKCYQMKTTFEAREKECSDWLRAVRAPITNAKNQCSRLAIDYENRKIEDFERDMLQNDVLRLHRYTLVAWQTVYGACQQAKELCNKFQNPFLRIMLDNLVTVSDNLFYMLMEIDNFLKEKHTIVYILQKFETIKHSDILATWELRELEASGHGHYVGIRDPLVYSNSIVKIEEVANISNSTRV
uniref:Coiled-coil domain-containing protein 14 n=1 Tax=Caenorhabditis tropicalis TaxID=1561998 RepID=A0A1I7UGG7_9PELO